MTTDRRTLLAITNAEAGSAADDAVEEALSVLRGAAEVTVAATSGPEDLAKALADHADVEGVVVLGGDGSLHAVVQALRDAGRLDSVVVGLVPLGTGNDFARTIGLPDEPGEAARVVVEGDVQRLDLAVTGDGEVVVNAVHAGVGADAAAIGAPLKKVLGPWGYAWGTAIAGFTRPGVVVEVRVDGRVVSADQRVLQVAAGNGRFVGGGAELLPEADPADGLLDIAISTAAPPLRRLGYVLHLRDGRHQHRGDVQYLRGHEVTVQGAPTRATNDGELGEPSSSHTWSVVPSAWQLVVPT